jgi:hypothetical protein
MKGTPMPAFNLLLVDSTSIIKTTSFGHGQPIVLFFFEPDCPYSRAQMEEIVTHLSMMNEIMFYVFTTSSYSDFKSFYNYYHLEKYQNIKAGIDLSNFFVNYFKATSVPYLAIYGKNGLLKEVFNGKIYTSKIKETANE